MSAAAPFLPARPRSHRILGVLAVAAAAMVTLPFTLASVQNGAGALRWWPSASARADAAAALVANAPDDPVIRHRAGQLASDALRNSPVSAQAARVLGLVAASAGDERRADAAFEYALRLSRRDTPTHIWFIERAVADGNIGLALRHYDQAMRTSVSSRAVLIPVLVSAAQNRPVADRLLPLLARRPNWWGAFVHMLIGTSPNADVLYRFSRMLNLSSADPDHPDFLGRTIDRLANAGLYDQALDLYARDTRTDRHQLLRNGSFERPNTLPPFDWEFTDDSDLAGVVQARPDGRGTALFLSAQAGRGGTVAQQLLRLAPGASYRLTLTAGGVSSAADAERPRLMVRCAAGDTRLAELILPTASDSGRRVETAFGVPAGCATQRLIVEARGSLSGTSDAMPWVDEVAIESTRG